MEGKGHPKLTSFMTDNNFLKDQGLLATAASMLLPLYWLVLKRYITAVILAKK